MNAGQRGTRNWGGGWKRHFVVGEATKCRHFVVDQSAQLPNCARESDPQRDPLRNSIIVSSSAAQIARIVSRATQQNGTLPKAMPRGSETTWRPLLPSTDVVGDPASSGTLAPRAS